MKTRHKLYSLFLFTTLLLTGCERPPSQAMATQSSTTQSQQSQKAKVLSELQQLGLRYQLSNGHLIVLLPVNQFFQKDTIHLKSGYDRKVIRLAQVLRDYSVNHPVHSIHLVAYPDKQKATSGLLLPHQYAVVVAGYLWDQGLPMRMSGRLTNADDRQWVHSVLPRARARHGVVVELS